MTKSRRSSKFTTASNNRHSFRGSSSSYLVGTDPSELLFPEWSDYDLNIEKWDIPIPKSSSPSPKDTSNSLEESIGYTDPYVFNMPPSIQVDNWKRPHQLYPDVEILIYKQSNDYSDFLRYNKHIFHSEFIRSFVSSIGILEYISKHSQWKIEGTNAHFEVNNDNLPWKPWHHVYSMCKAGKDYLHEPVFNKHGKYVVRLFWMGCWRKVTVDDRIPVDKTSHLLLPTLGVQNVFKRPESAHKKSDRDSSLDKETKKKKGKEQVTDGRKSEKSEKQKLQFDKATATTTTLKEVELWPFLLCKALLKLANLTWNSSAELEEFNIIHSLTGWVVQSMETTCFKSDDIWKMCAAYSENYTWPDDRRSEEAQKSAKSSTKKHKTSASSDKSSKRSSFRKDRVPVVNSLDVPYYLMATISDLRDAEENLIENFTPCWAHEFLVLQTRNTPLERLPESVAHTWKRFRWIEWATRNGLHREMDPSIKCLKMMSVFKMCYKHVVYTIQSEKMMHNKSSVIRRRSDDDIFKYNFSEEIDVQGIYNPEDIFWCDFNKLGSYIRNINIYFRPSTFTTNLHISDVNMKETKNKKGQDTASNYILWPHQLLKCRNEPLFIYLNSPGDKCLVFVLSSSSGSGRLEHVEDETICCKLVIEKYDWTKTAINNDSFCLTARGTTSTLVVLQPGKSVFRLWITSPHSFHLQILSETAVVAGSEEVILENMTEESVLLTEMCNKVADSFGKWVNTFGSQQYKEAARAFYNSYLPDTKVLKSEASLIHERFLEELGLVFQEIFSDAHLKSALLAIKVLFLTVTLPKANQVQDTLGVTSSSLIDVDDIAEAELLEQSVLTIQTYFRLWRTRRLLEMHSLNNPNFSRIFDALRSIYKEIFSIDSRMHYVPRIIRSLVLLKNSVKDVWQSSSLQDDLKMVLHLQDFTGETKVTHNSWTILCRYEFNIASTEEEVVKFSLYSNASYYFLRVFNNKTNKEMVRVANNVTVGHYRRCSDDYTVLAYGWTGIEETTFWKLRMVTVKNDFGSSIVVKEAAMKGNFLCDYYFPNNQNLICRLQVGIKKSTPISVRLVCSLDSVKVKLRCTHGDVFVYNEIVGTGSVILPVTKLHVFKDNKVPIIQSKSSLVHKSRTSLKKKREKTESISSPCTTNTSVPCSSLEYESFKNFYLVEAYVLGDTWPLTKDEWGTVEEVKKRKDCILPTAVVSKSSLESSKAMQKFQLETFSMNKPYWYIQIFGNVKYFGGCNIDRRRQEKIESIKSEWTNDLTRYEESHELRESYLNKLHSDSSQFFMPVKKFMVNEMRSCTKININGQILNPLNYKDHIINRNYGSSFDADNIMKCYGKVKTMKDIEEDDMENERSIDIFRNRYEEYQAVAAAMLEQDVTRNARFDLWAKAARVESSDRMISAYKSRDSLILNGNTSDKKKKSK